VGAGLGGGSSDAGVALRLANRLLPTPLEPRELVALAAEVGSDVPFFAAGYAAAQMRGRGESVRAVRLHARPVIAIAWPGVALSTADVYAAYSSAWSEQGFARASDSIALAARADLRTLTALVANDLADAAERLCPASAALRRELRARGALVATVSGSGSAVFGIFETRGLAEAALADLPGATWSAASSVLDPATILLS
jgi:4-diphosphocytidyl-2-C-methyl-D-erythritol kinase